MFLRGNHLCLRFINLSKFSVLPSILVHERNMDVTRPELRWIQSRCYRVNPTKIDYTEIVGSSTATRVAVGTTDTRQFSNEEVELEYECDPEALGEEDDSQYQIEQLASGGFQASVDKFEKFFPVIIGQGGSTRKRLEAETKTKLEIPRWNQKGPMVIKGPTRKSLLTVLRRIEIICAQARLRWEPTHFLCFPLNTPEVVSKVREFQKAVLELMGTSMDESIFMKPEKIHFTITVAVILDATEREDASAVFQGLGDKIKEFVPDGKLEVRLKGLDCMNDDPSAVRVLFAKMDPPNESVQVLANHLEETFRNSKYGKKGKGPNVKLHATLMNTKYIKNKKPLNPDDTSWKKRRSNEKFDAREILKKLGDFDFGTAEVKEVRLAAMSTVGKDGFYSTLSSVTF